MDDRGGAAVLIGPDLDTVPASPDLDAILVPPDIDTVPAAPLD